mgnify:CR=1 FL=1
MKVVALVGPTAVGKTGLGVAIAEAIGGEVVSADSRQVYRGFDIGTGKVTSEEARGIPHHLIDVADAGTIFTAADFVRLGRATLEDVAERGHTPIVVGGTGFYIDALLGRMRLAEVPPNEVLRLELKVESLEELQEKLKKLDPERYKTIDTKNRRRLERAIEIALSGTQNSELKTLNYKVLWLGLTLSLPELKKRIHTRLLARLDAGMLDEARHLNSAGLTWGRMEDLGLEYRYMARHLQNLITYDEMVAELEKGIVSYAKRQMTWFKRNKEILWLAPDDPATGLEQVRAFLNP